MSTDRESDLFHISDEEGDPAEGRISPCTFRYWAKGCSSWADEKSDRVEEEEEKPAKRIQIPISKQENGVTETSGSCQSWTGSYVSQHCSSLSLNIQADSAPLSMIEDWRRIVHLSLQDESLVDEPDSLGSWRAKRSEESTEQRSEASSEPRTFTNVSMPSCPSDQGELMRRRVKCRQRCV